jgi:hypothetical protein
MTSLIRLDRVENEAAYAINPSEIALIVGVDTGAKIAFTGIGEGFGFVHDDPAGNAGVTVKQSVDEILALLGRAAFFRVTPIETSQDHIFEGPETYVQRASVRLIYKGDQGPKTWVVFNSFFYVREGAPLPEQVRPCVLGIRESVDEIMAQ